MELARKINKAIHFTNVHRLNCSINAVCSLWLKNCFKRCSMFTMSAILLDNTFHMLSPFTDTVINELPRQRAPLVHDCLFQQFHGFKLSAQYARCFIIYQDQVLTVWWPHRKPDKGVDSCRRSTLWKFISVVPSYWILLFNFCMALFVVNCWLLVPKIIRFGT